MSTLSADLQSSQSDSTKSLPASIWSGMKKVASVVSHYFVALSEAVYEARKEEIRQRIYYKI